MLENLFGGKPWFKSVTAWGIVIFAAGSAAATGACEVGLLSTSACATVMSIVKWTGGILVTLGLRKAATAPNTV